MVCCPHLLCDHTDEQAAPEEETVGSKRKSKAVSSDEAASSVVKEGEEASDTEFSAKVADGQLSAVSTVCDSARRIMMFAMQDAMMFMCCA